MRITCAAISPLTRDRFDDGHDELLHVTRKQQDRFARVVQGRSHTPTPRP